MIAVLPAMKQNILLIEWFVMYLGHFINNAQGGKTAEWMMQSQ
jgi:hypothetical protein